MHVKRDLGRRKNRLTKVHFLLERTKFARNSPICTLFPHGEFRANLVVYRFCKVLSYKKWTLADIFKLT